VSLQDTGEGSHCIMVDRPSNAFSLLRDPDTERKIFEKVFNRELAVFDNRLSSQGCIEKMVQLHHDLTNRSGD